MSQLALNLPHSPLFLEENFFVSECNRQAHEWTLRWPDWPAGALLLYGPPGSGKSHLARLWAERSRADSWGADIPVAKSNLLIENIERLADDRALFHLLNTGKENGHFLLLTSSLPPKQLPFTLPDLTSRLLALPAAAIDLPDDAALAGALRKQFADRQLKVEEEVIAYLLSRMERSFGQVREAVEKLDRAALSEGKSLTVPFAKRVLGY